MKKWTIGVCTLEKRKKQFHSIFNKLMNQIKENGYEEYIAIVTRPDNGEQTVGFKRNNILVECAADYISFVDDDDNVSDDFIKTYFDLAQENKDCIELWGRHQVDGEFCKIFKHSIIYKNWWEDDAFYYRCPNHLNLIKTEHAKKIGFGNIKYGEDSDFSKRLRDAGLLKTESKCPKITYEYNFNSKK